MAREATGLHQLATGLRLARGEATSPEAADLPPLVPKAQVSGELLEIVVAMSAGQRNAECCICFEYLHEQPQGQLCCGPAQRAACSHFFHHACALNLLNSNTRTSRQCPVCRASYARVKPVPQLTADPDGWFAAVDTGGEGYLSRREVLNVLVAQFPVDMEKLEKSFDALWKRWDVTGSGYLTKAEFVHPERGLLNFVRANLLHEPVVAPPSPEPSPSDATHAATGAHAARDVLLVGEHDGRGALALKRSHHGIARERQGPPLGPDERHDDLAGDVDVVEAFDAGHSPAAPLRHLDVEQHDVAAGVCVLGDVAAEALCWDLKQRLARFGERQRSRGDLFLGPRHVLEVGVIRSACVESELSKVRRDELGGLAVAVLACAAAGEVGPCERVEPRRALLGVDRGRAGLSIRWERLGVQGSERSGDHEREDVMEASHEWIRGGSERSLRPARSWCQRRGAASPIK